MGKEKNPNQAIADRLYDDFLVGYPEYWEGNEGVDVEETADRIFDKIVEINCDENDLYEDGVQDLVYEHIYAGLN